jgi:hypothetical protein
MGRKPESVGAFVVTSVAQAYVERIPAEAGGVLIKFCPSSEAWQKHCSRGEPHTVPRFTFLPVSRRAILTVGELPPGAKRYTKFSNP